MANLYCDRYSECNSFLLDRGGDKATESVARARGWHIFHGLDHGGKQHDAVLCDQCVDDRRRKLDPAAQPQRGQQTLFSIDATWTAP